MTIAALDHRGSLKNNLHPENPEVTTDEEIQEWKRRMIELYSGKVSGILIDPIYGKELIDTTLACGWMVSMEKTGYRGRKEQRVTELLPNWSVRQAKELGASGVKLLLYYDPENLELAEKQKQVAQKVAEECRRERMIFLLEPLSYKKSKEPYLVERIVDDLIDLPVDVFKLEYPGSKNECERITKKLEVPWVLLSAGVAYDQYKEQLRVACESGAAGMAVGRAAWQELGQYEGEARAKFFCEVAGPRMDELVEIVKRYGKAVDNG
ncbi:MAG: tagatose 1,6-diphosphate aldolase [bacterium]